MLHVFDLDGTLLRGTTASLEIASVLGTSAELIALEREFSARRIDTRGFAQRLGELWGGLTVQTVREAFDQAPFLTGIREVVGDIRERGEVSSVITMTPNFFADLLSEFGFDHIASSQFPSLPLREAPIPERILVPESKVTISDAWLTEHGLSRDECVGYGDSLSDLPLFRTLTHSSAINASAELRALSSVSYEGDSLWDAYIAVRETLPQR